MEDSAAADQLPLARTARQTRVRASRYLGCTAPYGRTNCEDLDYVLRCSQVTIWSASSSWTPVYRWSASGIVTHDGV